MNLTPNLGFFQPRVGNELALDHIIRDKPGASELEWET